MVETLFNVEEDILYVTVSGTVELEDMFSAMDVLTTNPRLPRNLKILENATKAKILFNVKDLGVIAEKVIQNISGFDSIRHAVIHSEPIGSAFVIIVNKMIDHSGYKLKEFSHEKNAKDWLKYTV
jgi:hypothetical protein